jgi:hypothetical protein
MTILDLSDEVVADIIKRNTVVSEFDCNLTQLEVNMRVKKIKQQLHDAVDELESRPLARRMQEL